MNKYVEMAKILSYGSEILPNVECLAKKLKWSDENKTPLRIKLGMDPTKPDLHLGHTVTLRKAKQYQDAGHQIVLIIGDVTAMIGDPSGRSESRKNLTKSEVEENAKTYLNQIAKVIDIDRVQIVYNSQWLSKLTFDDLMQLAGKVTVAQMLARDDFSKRYTEGKAISIHEFFYPLIQAYDSVAIKSDIELGGTDQRFNVLMGMKGFLF